MADAQQRLISEALDGGNEQAWSRFILLFVGVWGARALFKQQVTRFMEITDLPAALATPRIRSVVHGGDDQKSEEKSNGKSLPSVKCVR